MDEKKEKACNSSGAVMLGDLKSSSERRSMLKKNAETVLRLMPMGLCLAALVIMIKNAETSDYGSVSYDNFGGFKYLVYANGICAGYSILSALLTAVPGSVTHVSRAWTVFFFDQVLTYMILAAGAASVEVLYLAKKGDIAITWSPSCGEYGGFCNKAMAAIIITFAAVACYVVLSVISSFRLFSIYDAPISCPGEVATFPS